MCATGPLLENAIALSINQRLGSEYLFVILLYMHLWTFLLYFIVTWRWGGVVWGFFVGLFWFGVFFFLVGLFSFIVRILLLAVYKAPAPKDFLA